jgi:hypothetical protein
MELPVVSALEFEEIRDSIKNFIKNNTDFQGYDFEGSNMSMLVDILSYNTLYTTYNVNMASNELNLDTAVLRDNIVSISKRLGYTPSSYTSSKIKLNITASDSSASNNGISKYDIIRLKKGSVLNASSNNKNYTFVATDDLDVSVKNRTSVQFNEIELFEGTEFVISYTVDESNEHQRFFIPNNFIDSETIKVSVISDPENSQEVFYTRKDTIVDVSNSDTVFFVEEVQDQKYEVVFGDDVLGRKLRNGEIVKIKYIITNGGEANAISGSSFKFVGRLEGINSDAGVNTAVTLPYNLITFSISNTTPKSDGGSSFETARSIKYRAPRAYAAQDRAVTLSDYESLITKIYANTGLVKVISGESLNQPQFGKVVIIIKPTIGEKVSESEKSRIGRELIKYKVGSIAVEIKDARGITFVITPKIVYDTSKTRNRENELKTLVNNFITEYLKTADFNKFGGSFSDLTMRCGIKSLDPAILFVGSELYLKQAVQLLPGQLKNYITDFYTKLKSDIAGEYYAISEFFCHKGIASPVFIGAKTSELIADCSVDLNLYLITSDGVVLDVIGSIDIETGVLNYTVEACDGSPQDINILVVPEVLDIVVDEDVVPDIEIEDILIYPNPNPDDITGILDPGGGSLPDISDTTTTGDPNVVSDPPPLITEGPGGGTVVIPTIPGITPGDPGGEDSDDPIIKDPNDIGDIEDYTPETNPFLCS